MIQTNDFIDVMWSLKKRAVITIRSINGELITGIIVAIRQTSKDNKHFTVDIKRQLGEHLSESSVTHMIKTGE